MYPVVAEWTLSAALSGAFIILPALRAVFDWPVEYEVVSDRVWQRTRGSELAIFSLRYHRGLQFRGPLYSLFNTNDSEHYKNRSGTYYAALRIVMGPLSFSLII